MTLHLLCVFKHYHYFVILNSAVLWWFQTINCYIKRNRNKENTITIYVYEFLLVLINSTYIWHILNCDANIFHNKGCVELLHCSLYWFRIYLFCCWYYQKNTYNDYLINSQIRCSADPVIHPHSSFWIRPFQTM